MYADDFSDKIVCGDAKEYWIQGAYLPGGVHYNEIPWCYDDWATTDINKRKELMQRGALYKYVKNVKAYKCPRAEAIETRSFSIVDSMNGYVPGGMDTGAILIKNRQQIKKAYERIVFADDGGADGLFLSTPRRGGTRQRHGAATELHILLRMPTPNTKNGKTQVLLISPKEKLAAPSPFQGMTSDGLRKVSGVQTLQQIPETHNFRVIDTIISQRIFNTLFYLFFS
jgi:hypothetical protein